MALRIDTAEWISGALVIGDTGLGVLGSDIPSTGDNGAGYAYNDLSLPADANKEICGRITTWPSAGTLFAYEDTSFEFFGAPDGTYTFEYQLYVDGVATGSPQTVTLQIGTLTHSASGSLTSGAATVVGTAALDSLLPHVATGSLAASSASVSGAAYRVAIHTSSGALVAGNAGVVANALLVGVPITHIASGVLVCGAAVVVGYDRNVILPSRKRSLNISSSSRPARLSAVRASRMSGLERTSRSG